MLRMTSRIIRIAPSGGRTPLGTAAVFWELPLGMLRRATERYRRSEQSERSGQSAKSG